MIKLLKKIQKRELIFSVFCIIFIIMQVVLELKLPDYMSEVTVLIQTEGSSISSVLHAGGLMLLCSLGTLIVAFISGFFSSKIGAGVSMHLRELMFDKVQNFSMEEINNFSTASLITRTTNDITFIQIFISIGLVVSIKAPFLAIWAILKILKKNILWSFSTLGAVILLACVLSVVIFVAISKFKKVQTLTDNLNRVTRETLIGQRVVRAYNAESHEEEKFDSANKELSKTTLFAVRAMALLHPTMGFIMNALTLSIYWIGAYIINSAALPDKNILFGDMVVFTSYSVQVIMAFILMAFMFIQFPRAEVCAKRINEVLDTESKLKDGKITNPNTDIKGEIEFKNVYFKYPNATENVLTDISFKANKGETIAVIGSTGCGKSTLVNLIPRFFDSTSGEITIDGINIKDYNLETLYRKIGYVSQSAFMFNASIFDNISYGEEPAENTMERVQNAAKIAKADEFIELLPDKYLSPISEGGHNISGGQKQRVSIARAIFRNPEIMIFDDSFSALDYKTDRLLRKELAKYTKDTTKIIVAQRIGTIRDADKIIVLDEGKIVGMGKHNELMENCEVYRQIAFSQLSKEEL